MYRSTTTGFDRARRMLERLAAASGRRLLEQIGSVLARQTDQRFETKRGPDQQRWREWSPAYAATRPPGASLLIDSGALRELIEQRIGGERVELVARTPYAGHVQRQRPFLGIGSMDADELRRAVEEHFREAIGVA